MANCEICGSDAKRLYAVKISLRSYGINHMSEKMVCASCREADKKGLL